MYQCREATEVDVKNYVAKLLKASPDRPGGVEEKKMLNIAHNLCNDIGMFGSSNFVKMLVV